MPCRGGGGIKPGSLHGISPNYIKITASIGSILTVGLYAKAGCVGGHRLRKLKTDRKPKGIDPLMCRFIHHFR